MTAVENPTARRVRRWLSCALLLALAWLVFRLFEPVFTWSFGWQPLPSAAATNAVADANFVDPAWADTARDADALLRGARGRLHTPALSAAIAIDGRRVWAGATGWSDIAAARRVGLDSRFRLGSTSKFINALAIARLVDAGRLDLDAPVRSTLADLPASYDKVTTREAITHTAGIPDYGLCLCLPVWEHKNRRHFTGVHDALSAFTDEPLRFAPGTDFAYSSYGANLAGAVAEAAAKRPYLELVPATVFVPLGMTHSRFDIAGADDRQRVTFYDITERQAKLADPVDNSIRYPSGGLLSTPSDMLAAGQTLLAGDFISAPMRKQMLTPQKLADGSDNPQGYALGIRVNHEKKLFDGTVTTTFYTHHGTAVGSTSYFAVYPEYGLVISIMMNEGQENLDAMGPEAQRLVELFVAKRRLAAVEVPVPGAN